MATVSEVLKDTKFQALPFEEKRKVLVAIDTRFAGLPPTEQTRAMNAMGAGVLPDDPNATKNLASSVYTPALEAAGMMVGGAVAAPGVVTTAAGGALGYAGGKEVAKAIDRKLGIREAPKDVADAALETGQSIKEGATMEMAGGILGKVVVIPAVKGAMKLAEAAKKYGVRLTPAELLKWKPASLFEALLEKMPLSAGMVQRFRGEQGQALEKAAQGLVDKLATVNTPQASGGMIQKAIKETHLARIEAKNKLFNRLAELTEEVPATETFYHVTTKDNVPSIMQKGLLPGYASLREGPVKGMKDVYLTKSLDRAKDMVEWMKDASPDMEQVVLKVELPKAYAKKLRPDVEMPELDVAFTGKIPSKYISDDLTKQLSKSGVSPVKLTTVSRTAQQLLSEQNKLLEGVPVNQELKKFLFSLTNPEASMSFQGAKLQREWFNSQLPEGYATTTEQHIYQRLKRALDEDIGAWASQQPGKIEKAYRLANEAHGSIKQLYSDPNIQKIIKSNPEDVINVIFQPGQAGSITELQLLRKAVKPDDWPVVQQAIIKRLFDGPPNVPPPVNFLKNMNRYGDNTLNAALSPETVSRLKEFAELVNSSAGRSVERMAGNPSGTGQTLLTWGTTIGQGGLLLTHPVTGVATIISPPIAAKLYLSNAGRKLLTEGFRISPESARAAAIASGIATLNRREQQNSSGPKVEPFFPKKTQQVPTPAETYRKNLTEGY